MTKNRGGAGSTIRMHVALKNLDNSIIESSKLERELHGEKVEKTVERTIHEFLIASGVSQQEVIKFGEQAHHIYLADLSYIAGNPNLNILPIRYARLESLSPSYDSLKTDSLKPKERKVILKEIVEAMLAAHKETFTWELNSDQVTGLVAKIDLNCDDDRRYKNKILQHTYCVRRVNQFAKEKLFPHSSNAMFPTKHEDVVKVIDKIEVAYRKNGLKSTGSKINKSSIESIVERHLKNWKPFASKVWLSSTDSTTSVPHSPYSMEIERYLMGAKKQFSFYMNRNAEDMLSGREPSGTKRDFRPDFLSTAGVMVEFKSLPKQGLVAFIALPDSFSRTKALARLLASHQNQLGLPEIKASMMQDLNQAIEVRSMQATTSESERLVEFITEFCEELKP